MTDKFALIKAAYNQCILDRPLEYDDVRRVDMAENGSLGSDTPCIQQMRQRILLSDDPVRQLFTGFPGSGKSTELRRLKKELEDQGAVVILIDADDYLNLQVPIQISDILILVAAGVDSWLEQHQSTLMTGAKRFWERMQSFFQTELAISEATVETGAEVGVEGAKAGAKAGLKLTFKQDRPFREKVTTAIRERGRLSDLARACQDYLVEALAALRGKFPHAQCVLIVDSLEKLGGDFSNREAMLASIERTFINDADLLRDIPFHVVWTIPPWLAFVDVGIALGDGTPFFYPMCRIRHRDGTPDSSGVAALEELLAKRFVASELLADPTQLRILIEKSGGYPRDLLLMVRDLLTRLSMDPCALPAPKAVVAKHLDLILARERQNRNLAIVDENLPLLARVARDCDIRNHGRDEVHAFANLLSKHFILAYQNGERWFNLHPLVRDTEKIKAELASAASAP
jgi:hypothetical protein